MLSQMFVFLLVGGYSLGQERFVELNHDLGPHSKFWPAANVEPFKSTPVYDQERFEEGQWYSANTFCSPEHVGTHLDAPSHFHRHGWSVDQIPLRHLIGPACIVNVKSKVDLDPKYELSPSDLDDWVASNGVFPNNSIVIAMTGWGQRYSGSAVNYFGSVTNLTQLVFPGISPEAVNTLLSYRESHGVYVVGIGIDGPSLDYGPSQDFPSHRIINTANIYGLENLINLQQVPAKGAELTVMPIKIRGGTGGPCRVIARIPDTVSACTKMEPTLIGMLSLLLVAVCLN